MADGTYAAPDVLGEADDLGQTVLGGGGAIASRSPEDLPALPSGAASVEVGQWPPSSWGPKRYQIDASGNRVPGTVAAPGE
jgi:hypothetical protein